MKMVKQIAVLAFAALMAQCVWAATPVVVWDWDFDTTEKTGTDNQVYTLDLQGNSLENGCIKITQDVGATITPAQAARNGNYTIMIRYSNLKSVNHKAALISLSTTSSNIENIGVYAAANALKPSAYWDNNQTDYPLAEDLSVPAGAGYAQVAYAAANALYFWADKTVVNDTTKDAFANGLKFSNTTIDQIGIGGPVRATNTNAPTAWDGVVIESVALYKGNYLAVSSTVGQTYTYGDMAYRATIESDGVAFADLTWENATTGLTADYADIPANAKIVILGSGSVAIPQDLSRTVYLGEHVTATLPESQTTSAIFVGRGAVAYTGAIPSTTQTAKFSSAADWKGTVWVKNYGTDNGSVVTSCLTGLKSYGNVGSKVKFSGVKGYTPDETASCPYELVLEDDGAAFSWRDDNGWSNRAQHTFAKLSGSGKLLDGNGNNNQALVFTDVSSFVGTIDVRGKKITLGGSANLATANGGIAIAEGTMATIAANKAWTAGVGGILVKGTLNVAADATISGAIKIGYKDATIVAKKELDVTCDVSGYEAHTEVDEESATWTYTVIKPAIDHPVTTEVSNTLSIEGISIVANGVQTLAGVGGVQIGALSMTDGAKIVLDPIRTPIKLATKPMIAAGAKIALSGYSTCALGKFTLMTWSGDAIDVPSDLFDETSVSGTAVVICEEAPETGHHQLTLKVGDYDAEAAEIRIMPLGDSITEGTSGDGFARPNYRHYLMAKLEANGYKAISCGYQRSAETFDGMGAVIANSAGVVVPLAHQWHCGMSGQQCRTTGAAGWEDSIDVALDSAGYPDIVTFKIGTNDIKGSDYTRAKFITAWKNVINRILVARPNVKVVVGTIVDPSGDATETRAVNEEMKAAVADGESFPANRVYVADLNAACPRYSGSVNNFKDGLHPNWIGHDKTSDCYLEKILAIADSLEAPTKVINTNHGASNNIPDSYRKGFVKIATITPTATWKLSQGIDSIVSVEPGMDEVSFDRVGYYMELQRKDMDGTDSYQEHVRYVWADMDAFGDKNLASFGISSTMVKRQQVVNNLHVYSNDTGIRKVDPTVTTAKGFVEFCKAGFGTAAGSSEAGAPAQRLGYDWNDTLNAGDSGYGCFQIHRAFAANESWNEGEVLMAFNRWTGDNVNEIGIGSFAQKIAGSGRQTIDYVYTAGLEKFSSAAYDAMSIEIWGVPEATTPEYVPADKVAEYESWAEAHAEELKLATPEQAKAGFLLNCAPTEAAILAAAKELKLTISFDEKGEPVVTTTHEYIVQPTIQRSSDLKTWGETGNFFRAVIE